MILYFKQICTILFLVCTGLPQLLWAQPGNLKPQADVWELMDMLSDVERSSFLQPEILFKDVFYHSAKLYVQFEHALQKQHLSG